MRPDLAKCVTERPRNGGTDRVKGENRELQRQIQDETLPKCEGMRSKWIRNWGGKSFTDVLGPLYGYLVKQVDRHWDDVYSEICKNMPANSNQGSHIRDHVFDFVELHIKMFAGIPHRRDLYRWGGKYEWVPLDSYGRRRPFALYVHPETGILCKYLPKRDPKTKEEPKLYVETDDPLVQYHKVNGIWYECQLGEYYLYIEWKYPASYRAKDENGGGYVMSRQQLNKREIKKLGLKCATG